jgi:hypothetical protein
MWPGMFLDLREIANSQTDQIWAYDPLDECLGLNASIDIQR